MPDLPSPLPDRGRPADDLLAAGSLVDSDSESESLRLRVAPHLPTMELGASLGRGGMGTVFRAHQPHLDRDVAVKVLTPPPAKDEASEEWSARFQREARALSRLAHPGIVTFHDFGEADGLAWIVMEAVEGTSLRALLLEGRLTPEEALGIAPQICSALQYAHDQGVVHRDIKPENVLIDESGHVKLVDFGLAKLATGETLAPLLTRSDQAMGTLRYMAPEQLDSPRTVDHRADIFSLGVVLYEMLTGQVPQGVIAPPSKRSDVDPRVDEVILKSLEREPSQRFQRASDLHDQVEAIRSGRGEMTHQSRLVSGLGTAMDWFTFLVPAAYTAAVYGVVKLSRGESGTPSSRSVLLLMALALPLIARPLLPRFKGRISMPLVRVVSGVLVLRQATKFLDLTDLLNKPLFLSEAVIDEPDLALGITALSVLLGAWFLFSLLPFVTATVTGVAGEANYGSQRAQKIVRWLGLLGLSGGLLATAFPWGTGSALFRVTLGLLTGLVLLDGLRQRGQLGAQKAASASSLVFTGTGLAGLVLLIGWLAANPEPVFERAPIFAVVACTFLVFVGGLGGAISPFPRKGRAAPDPVSA